MHSYDISRIYMAFFFYPLYIFFLWKNQVHMLKKHVNILWKKSWSWLSFSQYVHDFVMLLFQQISEKIRLTKNVQRVKKKKHKYLSWKSRIFFGVLAPIYLIIKYHNFLQKKYGFLGVGFLLRRGRGGGLFITPAGTFSDVLQYSSPLPNLHRTIGVDSKNYNSY